MSHLRDHINELSAAEKLELLDLLWESLESESILLSETQRAELDRRVARHQQDPSAVVPWEQVKVELFRKS